MGMKSFQTLSVNEKEIEKSSCNTSYEKKRREKFWSSYIVDERKGVRNSCNLNERPREKTFQALEMSVRKK